MQWELTFPWRFKKEMSLIYMCVGCYLLLRVNAFSPLIQFAHLRMNYCWKEHDTSTVNSVPWILKSFSSLFLAFLVCPRSVKICHRRPKQLKIPLAASVLFCMWTWLWGMQNQLCLTVVMEDVTRLLLQLTDLTFQVFMVTVVFWGFVGFFFFSFFITFFIQGGVLPGKNKMPFHYKPCLC